MLWERNVMRFISPMSLANNNLIPHIWPTTEGVNIFPATSLKNEFATFSNSRACF